jgi:hypothetical protein
MKGKYVYERLSASLHSQRQSAWLYGIICLSRNGTQQNNSVPGMIKQQYVETATSNLIYEQCTNEFPFI